MNRRFISAVAIAASVGVYAFAADQATFILNNGERRSGELTATGPEAANFVNGRLTLSGQPVPLEQVAVIDFTGGGTPPAIELQRVPPTGGQAVVLRSGHAEGGKFVNIVRGDTLMWEDHNGQQQQYPLRDVTRIYLNSTNAHAAYRAPGGPATYADHREIRRHGVVPGNWPDQFRPEPRAAGGPRRQSCGAFSELSNSGAERGYVDRKSRQQRSVRHRNELRTGSDAGQRPSDAGCQRQRNQRQQRLLLRRDHQTVSRQDRQDRRDGQDGQDGR